MKNKAIEFYRAQLQAYEQNLSSNHICIAHLLLQISELQDEEDDDEQKLETHVNLEHVT